MHFLVLCHILYVWQLKLQVKIIFMQRIVFAIFMGLPLLSFAQPHVINPRLTYPDSPYVYIGVPNTLQITGTNKNLVLTIDNGNFSNGNNKNEYIATFSRPGTTNITVLENGKVVYRKKYFVKRVSDPVVLFAGKADTALSVKEIVAAPCLSISLPDCYINHKMSVVSFEAALIYQPGDTLNTGKGKNWCMHDEQKTLLKKLRPGNKILLTNIKAMGPDSMVRTLMDKVIVILP